LLSSIQPGFNRVQHAWQKGLLLQIDLATGAEIRRLKRHSGTIVRQFEGHQGIIYDLDVSAAGTWLASAGRDGQTLLAGSALRHRYVRALSCFELEQ
jgi:WD40 repeat protein